MQQEPLHAPKRLSSERRREVSESDRHTGWLLGALVALTLGGIGVAQVGQERGWFEREQVATIGNLFGQGQAGAGGSAALPARPMKTGELVKAEAGPQERFAGTVTLASESDSCGSLRNDLEYARQMVRKASGAPGPRLDELKREVDRIHSAGTRKGCWSGGPQQ